MAHGGVAAAEVEPDLAPCILRGGWVPGPEQRKLIPRLRCAPIQTVTQETKSLIENAVQTCCGWSLQFY